MCGIAAIFAYHNDAPNVDRNELLAIRDHMSSRGPDGVGEWLSPNERVGLGHRRLSIIDLSPTGAQPMFSEDGSLAIIFNGEIYNYRELRAKLEKEGRRFNSQSDTEVLLHLYASRREEMLKDVRGMYAFAIWDGRREGIFLARDPFGIKPLYYADDGKTLRVASQVKALLAGEHVDTSPDPAGHVGFFLWGHIPDPYTLHRGIRALPAGTTLWMDATGQKRQRTFCSITQILRQAEEFEIRNKKLEVRDQAAGNRVSPTSDFLRSSLSETVRYHLVADVPVGVFLSSGLDSTTIAALAAEQGGNLRTVTLGFEEYRGTENDEVPLAEQFAKRCGAIHETIWVSRDDFGAERDHLFDAMDRPTTDGVNTFFVSLAAKRANLKVALSGVGGDELFGSYPSFREIPSSVRWLRGWSQWHNIGRGARVVGAPLIRQFTSPKYAGLFEYGGTYSGAYLLRRGMFMPWELPYLLDPGLVREGWAELQTLLRLEETIEGLNNPRLKVSALELTWYMRHQLLRDSDWAGMDHSVEIRVPFVDVQVLRAIAPMLAGKLPPSKRDMAASATPLITPEMLDRRKTGFQIPVRDWLRDESRRAEFEIAGSAHRGLRGWAREVYSYFVTGNLPKVRRRRRIGKPHTQADILMLVSDAFGGFGGIAKFNRDFINALCACPTIERVTVVPRIASQETGALPAKLTYVTSALAGKTHFVRSALQQAQQLRRDSRNPVVICGHINLLPAAVAVCKLCGGQLYLIVHGIEAWKALHNRTVNACLRFVDHFIAVSSVTRRRFLRWSGLRQDGGMILPNSVDLAFFTPGDKPADLLDRYALNNRVVLLTVGRLAEKERYKGFDEVLELLPTLARDVPQISYLIVGDGPDRRRLERKAHQLGIADRVVFAGLVSEDEKPGHYRLADLYVMPSSGEGFGIVYLEALACGIPVIGSKVDGSRDALLNGQLGPLVNPRNPHELRAAILASLAESRADVKERRKKLEYFSVESFNRRVQQIVESIISDSPSSERSVLNPASTKPDVEARSTANSVNNRQAERVG
jgi:asparagine synthase (glutamine-hydrolysing)